MKITKAIQARMNSLNSEDTLGHLDIRKGNFLHMSLIGLHKQMDNLTRKEIEEYLDDLCDVISAWVNQR